MNSAATNLLQGALDLLILKSLVAGEIHGSGMSRRIQQIAGLLFPALYRMQEEGWIHPPRWRLPKQPPLQIRSLDQSWTKQLEAESKWWGPISWAIAQAWKHP